MGRGNAESSEYPRDYLGRSPPNGLGGIVENKITFRQGMIEVIAQPIPSQSLDTGDTALDIFFDTHPPAALEISKEATTDLHARFVKRKGALKWEPVNGWAKALIQDRMPWK